MSYNVLLMLLLIAIAIFIIFLLLLSQPTASGCIIHSIDEDSKLRGNLKTEQIKHLKFNQIRLNSIKRAPTLPDQSVTSYCY